ncbi:MAG: PQQ-dependent sugar dehydrogenase [Pseudomonadota bacterium]
MRANCAKVAGLAAILALAGCSSSEDPVAPPANAAPAFSSLGSVTVEENANDVVYTAMANDPDGDAVSFSLAGGPDAAAFALTPAGALTFAMAPDFEDPDDANSDNVYELTISATDGAASTTIDLIVTVTDDASGFSVRRIASGLSQPLFVAGRGDGSNRIFIVERTGRIEILNLDTGSINLAPFLDISATISTAGEFGLLGFALAPDFSTSGAFYVYASNTVGDTEIRRYQTSAGNSDIADVATENVILSFPQPATNHNAGWIGFGPDDLLYIASGDGGGAGDPFMNGQDRTTLLGALLRIDPSTDAFPADPSRDYAIPADNPFAAGGGAPEIYAYGLRNPFRASFDRDTGVLYIGDVGQGAIEEIDIIRPGEAGLNFGWPILEGTQTFSAGATAGLTPPIAEYAHGDGPREGDSITGGYVYRGPAESLQGQYVFADFIDGNFWSIPAASVSQGATISSDAFAIQTAAFAPDAGSLSSPASFGEDDAGNLYIADIAGDVFVVDPE